MKKLILTDPEYNTIMRVLKDALIAENGGKRHADLSVLYHDLGGQHGYGEEE